MHLEWLSSIPNPTSKNLHHTQHQNECGVPHWDAFFQELLTQVLYEKFLCETWNRTGNWNNENTQEKSKDAFQSSSRNRITPAMTVTDIWFFCMKQSQPRHGARSGDYSSSSLPILDVCNESVSLQQLCSFSGYWIPRYLLTVIVSLSRCLSFPLDCADNIPPKDNQYKDEVWVRGT